MPEGRGTHVLRSRGKKPTYYDTARTGGVGGKANTKQGECNVEFDPSMKMVATREIRPGEEIYADYGTDYRWEELDGEREGWSYVRTRRRGKETDEGQRRGKEEGRDQTKKEARERRGAERGRKEKAGEDSWRWVRPAILRKRWRIRDERGHESDDEEGEGIGGDRGGELDDEGGGAMGAKLRETVTSGQGGMLDRGREEGGDV